MKNLLIDDGHHLLFKMFLVVPTRIIGKNGKPILLVFRSIAKSHKCNKNF